MSASTAVHNQDNAATGLAGFAVPAGGARQLTQPGSVRHAVAEVHDPTVERVAADELKICAALRPGEEGGSSTHQHWVHSHAVLVDQAQLGRFRSQCRASDGDVALPGLRPPPFDFLRQVAGGETVAALSSGECLGEHHLGE